MTLPPIVRLFFAIDIPNVFKERLGEFIHELKKKTKGQQIRFSRPENLHITLQFLAEVQSDTIPVLLQQVQQAIRNLDPFNIELGKIVLFPNPYRPRVIVLDVQPQQAITALASVIASQIATVGLPTEDRPYRPHLTIGRIKQQHNVNLRLLPLMETPLCSAIHINGITLYRSEPHEQGSRYTPLATLPFSDEVA